MPKDMVEPTLVVIEPAAFGVVLARDVKHDGGLVPVFWVARAAQFGVGVLGQDAEESGGEGVVGVEGSCVRVRVSEVSFALRKRGGRGDGPL